MTGDARRVCWALARECRPDDVLVVGVATPIAAAAAFVARELLVPDLTIIVGGAVDAPPMDIADLVSDPPSAARQAPAVLGQRDLLSLLQRGAISLQFVSPVQVDREGAINTSRVDTAGGPKLLPGCLALPDTAALVGRLVAYRGADSERFFVDRVDHVTGMGRAPDERARFALTTHGVVAVVTDVGRRDIPGDDEWQPLDPVPAEANDLLDRLIDPSDLLAGARS